METSQYFQKYLDDKFDALHQKIDAVIHEHDKDILAIQSDITDIKKDTKWLNQKVWGALGIAAVIVIAGSILAANFRALNHAQIKDAVQPLSSDVEKVRYDIESIKRDVSSTQKTLQDYNFIVHNE